MDGELAYLIATGIWIQRHEIFYKCFYLPLLLCTRNPYNHHRNIFVFPYIHCPLNISTQEHLHIRVQRVVVDTSQLFVKEKKIK